MQSSGHEPLTRSRTTRRGTRSRTEVHGIVLPVEPDINCWQRFQAGKYVVDPKQNKLLPVWDSLVLVFIIIVSFRVPYQLGFCWIIELTHSPLHEEHFNVYVDYVIDVFFGLDIFLQLFISMPDPENFRWVRMPYVIIKKYVRSFLFTDVISVIPYGLLSRMARMRYGNSYKYLGILKILSLAKIQRIDRIKCRYDSRMGWPNAWTKLVKLVMLLILSIHWIACFWGGILSFQKIRELHIGNTWSDALRAAKPALFKDSHYEHPFELYTASLYWSCYTLTSIGYGDIVANNMVEAWAAILLMGACGVIWANIIGNICAITGALDADNVAHENEMDSVNNMLFSYDIPKHDRMQVREYFQRRKVLNNRCRYVELLDCMSPSLQGNIAKWMQRTLLDHVWIFRDAMTGESSDGLVVGLFRCFQFEIYPPKELVHLHGCFVCLRSGVALQLANILQPGAVWGIADLTVTREYLWERKQVLALSYLELQYLTRDSFWALVEDFPDEKLRIKQGACWLALKNAAKQGIIKDLLADYHAAGTNGTAPYAVANRNHDELVMEAKLSRAMDLLRSSAKDGIASKVHPKVDELLRHMAST